MIVKQSESTLEKSLKQLKDVLRLQPKKENAGWDGGIKACGWHFWPYASETLTVPLKDKLLQYSMEVGTSGPNGRREACPPRDTTAKSKSEEGKGTLSQYHCPKNYWDMAKMFKEAMVTCVSIQMVN